MMECLVMFNHTGWVSGIAIWSQRVVTEPTPDDLPGYRSSYLTFGQLYHFTFQLLLHLNSVIFIIAWIEGTPAVSIDQFQRMKLVTVHIDPWFELELIWL